MMSTERIDTFFKRLFFWKSPRSEAIFGFAWMISTLTLMPFILFHGRLLFNDDSLSFVHIPFVITTIAATILLYLIGVIFCTCGLYPVLKSQFKSKCLCASMAFFGAWNPLFAGILMLIVLLKQKRFAAALFALGGSVLYVFIPTGMSNPLPILFGGGLCLMIALFGVEEEEKVSLQFIFPLTLAISSQIFLFCYDAKLQFDIQEREDHLARLIRRPLTIDYYWERNDKGYPLDTEPVKSFVANAPEINFASDPKSAVAELERIKKEHPQFIASMNEFLNIPVSHIAHAKPKDGLLTGVLSPELNAFRRTKDILLMKIYAAPENKAAVSEANRDLIKLRDWAIDGGELISYLVAISLERPRLEALGALLSTGKYTREEFAELVASPVEWNQYLLYAFNSEVVMFKSVMEHLSTALAAENIDLRQLEKFVPHYLKVHFMRDYRFALDSYIKLCSQEESLSGMEKSRYGKLNEAEIKRNGYMLSAMLLPALDRLFQYSAAINDNRQMALIAYDVAEYRRKHGKLPENLDFLPEKAQSELHHQPFMYEKTASGFRIYSNTHNGKKPTDGEKRYFYQVEI